MSRHPPWSAVITRRPWPSGARPSRWRAGIASRPLASRTSSDTPRKMTVRPLLAFGPAVSPPSPFLPATDRPLRLGEVSTQQQRKSRASDPSEGCPRSPTSTHFLPLRRTIRADNRDGQRISVGGTTTYAKNTTMTICLKMMNLRVKPKEISHVTSNALVLAYVRSIPTRDALVVFVHVMTL